MSSRKPSALRVAKEYYESVAAERTSIVHRKELQEEFKERLKLLTPNVLIASYSFRGIGLWQPATNPLYGEARPAGFSGRYDLLEPATRMAARVALRQILEDKLVVSIVKPDLAPHSIGEIVDYPDFELLEITNDYITVG